MTTSINVTSTSIAPGGTSYYYPLSTNGVSFVNVGSSDVCLQVFQNTAPFRTIAIAPGQSATMFLGAGNYYQVSVGPAGCQVQGATSYYSTAMGPVG